MDSNVLGVVVVREWEVRASKTQNRFVTGFGMVIIFESLKFRKSRKV